MQHTYIDEYYMYNIYRLYIYISPTKQYSIISVLFHVGNFQIMYVDFIFVFIIYIYIYIYIPF